MNLRFLFVCVVSIQSVKSECDGAKCVKSALKSFIDNKTNFEDFNVNIDLPKFEQIKNVEISDLNKVLFQLTSWFEDKLNETNIMFQNVNDKTKIFVKTFDFNVDFEKGDVNIDVELTEKKNSTIWNNGTEIKANRSESLEYKKKPIINITEISKEKVKDNEIFKLDELDTTYYDADEDNSTDYPILDYVELYKDTTNEEFVYNPTEISTTDLDGEFDISNRFGLDNAIDQENETNGESTNPICQGNSTCEEFAVSIYPSIATIFVKNDSNNNQFNYYCDGVLLSDRVIMTDARCMMVSNKTLEPEDVLVFLGKASLSTIGGDEKILRVKQIMVHENFTSEGEVKNDLALVVLDEPALLTQAVHEACLSDRNEGHVEHAATTAWSVTGDLVPIIFNKEKSSTCYDKDSDIFCATYANHVAFCPSYGGVYAAKKGGKWCVEGVFYGDPEDRGICFTKDVLYTSLNNYTAWIDEVVMINKIDL